LKVHRQVAYNFHVMDMSGEDREKLMEESAGLEPSTGEEPALEGEREREEAASTRARLRAERLERRRRVRNNFLLVGAILGIGLLVVGLVVLLTLGGSGYRVPKVTGLAYKDARKKVEKAGLAIEIDATQDSSGDCSKLKVETQDPKPGTSADKDEVVTVRLKGLQDSPELTRDSGSKPSPEPPQTQAAAPAQPAAAAPAGGHVVCVDPGHSNHTGNEIDPATGLNVGDNGGAPGELQSNWELAQKTKAALEQAGYTVRLTKGSADSYASLRERADTGNACDIMVRLHYDDTGFTGVMRAPPNGARCPASDPSRITVIDPNVAGESNRLAADLASALGLSVRDDTGGTTQGNTTPPGHPTALIGSVISTVPIVTIENKMALVRGNPDGQNQVAGQIAAGISAFFQGR
jgi:N-acetylmuramoyl-L-alanine amidase